MMGKEMNKTRQLSVHLLFGTLLALLPFWTGCQNHIRNVDTTAQEYDRNLIKETYFLKPYEYNREEGKMTMQVYANKVTGVKLYENHRTIKQSTPYEFWRELYEIPMGLIVFPVGIVSHVINVVTLGIFPYRWCWTMDCYGLAALNPCLNVENSNRVIDEPLKNYRELADQREENEEVLMGNTDVTATVGYNKFTKKTDQNGLVTFSLLTPDGSNMLARTSEQRIIITTGETNPATYSWIVPRPLISRLNLAENAIKQYQQAPTGKKLAETVELLEKEGFHEVAYFFESEEIKKHNSNVEFMEEFNKANASMTEQ